MRAAVSWNQFGEQRVAIPMQEPKRAGLVPARNLLVNYSSPLHSIQSILMKNREGTPQSLEDVPIQPLDGPYPSSPSGSQPYRTGNADSASLLQPLPFPFDLPRSPDEPERKEVQTEPRDAESSVPTLASSRDKAMLMSCKKLPNRKDLASASCLPFGILLSPVAPLAKSPPCLRRPAVR